MVTIDPRLVALYNEYLENNSEEDFIYMLYMILDMCTLEIRKKISHVFAAWKRRINKVKNDAMKAKIEAYFDKMTTEELIKFQNTPWNELPDWLREALPKIVKNPEQCNFTRIYDLVSKKERQQEICASRITRYMEKNRIMTTDETGRKLDYDRMAEICNEVAVNYDLPATTKKAAQRVRITPRDLKNYTRCRVTPKSDKMAVLATVTGMPVWYLSGYGDNDIPETSTPLGRKPLTMKFRKNKKVA